MNNRIDGDNMNRKGFTLIELIATIVIIGVIALIATVSISSIIKKSTNQAYKNIEETMKTAAQNYMLKGNDFDTVTAETLIKNGFMDSIIDPKTKKSCYTKKSYVKVDKSKVGDTVNTDYDYNVCLICGKNYTSDYCKDKNTITLEYRNIEDEKSTYNTLGDSVDINLSSSVQIRYLTSYDIKTDLSYEFTDESCKEYFTISPADKNSFRVLSLGKLLDNKTCEIKVYEQKETENVLEPRTFKINIKNNNVENKEDKNIVMYEQLSTTPVKEENRKNTIDLENVSYILSRRFKVFNNKGEFLEEDTKNLKFELVNNVHENNEECIQVTNDGSDQVYDGIYDNKSIYFRYLTDGCDNLKLKVTSGDTVKYFGINLEEMIHIESFKINKKYVEINGTYSYKEPTSYSEQEIIYTPQTVSNDNFDCVSSNSSIATCEAKNGKLVIKGAGRPTTSGQYVYMTLKPKDAMSKANPIQIRVKVNNVVPTDFDIKCAGGYEAVSLMSYFCAGGYNQENYISIINVEPSNAIISGRNISVTEIKGTNQASKVSISTRYMYQPSFSLLNNNNRAMVKVSATISNTYEEYPVEIEKSMSVTIYPPGYKLLKTKYCK